MAPSHRLPILKGQLSTADKAKVTKKQHTKACIDCPFGRLAVSGWLADKTPEEWIFCIHGEGRMECHTKLEAPRVAWQCAGAAIFRANVFKVPRDPKLLILPASDKLVFGSNLEFWEHHTKAPFPWKKRG